MDEFLGAGNQDQNGGDNSVALFLGLYLLILAFFILLVSISTLEKVKSNAVMDSLSSAFTTLLPPSGDLTAFSAKDGAIIAGQEFQDEVAGLFATSLQVAKVEVVQPGREMRVVIPKDTLFLIDKPDIREAQYPLLDRIVASVSSRPPGMRYDLEFVIGVKPISGRDMPIGQTLEMARAGSFARFMVSRGAPPDSVSIGLSPGASNNVVIWFHVRGLGETRLRFAGEEEEEAQEPPARKKPAKSPEAPAPTTSSATASAPIPLAPTAPPVAGAPVPLSPAAPPAAIPPVPPEPPAPTTEEGDATVPPASAPLPLTPQSEEGVLLPLAPPLPPAGDSGAQ